MVKYLAQFSLLMVFISSAPVLKSLEVKNFEREIEKLANDVLGVQAFQTYLDNNVKYTFNDLTGGTLLNAIANRLSEKFKERFQIVKKLQEVVEEYFDEYTSNNINTYCDNVPLEGYDTNFGTETNRQVMCTYGEVLNNREHHPTSYPAQHLLKTMQDNLDLIPSIKWQYVGTEEGLLAAYPAFHVKDKTYDPRFRPWYVETATPKPKDVVVVIDKSGSMSHGNPPLIDIARNAAVTVIDTLNPNDRIGVVSFSGEAEIAPGNKDSNYCYGRVLAKATPPKKKKVPTATLR